MTKKGEKYSIHVVSVDFLQKIGYYAIDNYKIITYHLIEGRSIHEHEKEYCRQTCDNGC